MKTKRFCPLSKSIKGGRDYRLKPVELSSLDEAMKQEATRSLA